MTPSRDISRLIEIMAALRTPVTGCPWDLEQDFATIAPYTIEEAYEVVDAIARGDLDDLREELGDLLLQVVYHAQMAQEQNAVDFGDVVEAITRKMIRRNPHVFADKDGNLASSHVKEVWDRIKAEEKAERAARRSPQDMPTHKSLLSGVKAGQPALTRAMELQRKVSVGDEVVTVVGLHATVAAIEDDIVSLEIAPGVTARYERAAIARVIKPQDAAPAEAGSDAGDSAAKVIESGR